MSSSKFPPREERNISCPWKVMIEEDGDVLSEIERAIISMPIFAKYSPRQSRRKNPVSDKELIVHIGTSKTGTTSIQSFFWKQRPTIKRDYGIDYPGIVPNHGTVLFPAFAAKPEDYHLNVKGKAHSRAILKDNAKSTLQAFESIFQTEECKKVIISGEDLSNLDRNEVTGFREWIKPFFSRVKVLVFVREPVGWSESATQEWVKAGARLSSVYADPPLPRYKARLEPWIQVFGREAVSCFDFESARQETAGIVGTVCRLSGVPIEKSQASNAEKSNESLSHIGISIISALNQLEHSYTDHSSRPGRFKGDIELCRRIPGSKFQFPPRVARLIENATKADMGWLSSEMGIRFKIKSHTPTTGLAGDEQAVLAIAKILSELKGNAG